MPTENEYQGRCFCGAVELRVVGKPAAMGYCHCQSCRQWSASPVNGFTLWPPNAVTITRGAELVGSFSRSPSSIRKWCTRCGGHLLTEHPGFKLTDVYAAVIPELPFQAAVHVNYADTVLPLRDGLPKLRDFPKELEGTGQTVPE
ncbi:MAG TPA: GFA family protein [Polyangia bacterium]|jgi:hypothetical protein